jgi:hypothetical protein
MGSNAYPAKAAPASVTLAPELALQTPGADDETVTVLPDLRGGVQRYAISARALAASVARRGASLGIATFSRPLGDADVRELARIGLVISAVEGIAIAADGRVWTIGTAYGDTAFVQMEGLAAEYGLTLQGVVSAEITIADAGRLRLLQDDPRVFLVDLSIEQVRRSSGLRDVVQNDVYWNLAGWE